MNANAETETRPERTPPEQPLAGLGSFGLIHLAACLGAGGAVALAVALIEWLH
jgi:hypothetical protein